MVRLNLLLSSVVVAALAFAPVAFAEVTAPVSPVGSVISKMEADGLFNRRPNPPDINNIPVLASIVKAGAKLYYLGERSGLSGWFIVKDSQIQMIYVTADGQTALVGGMFTGAGDNVTGPQINALAETNKEVADLVNGSAKQQDDITKAGADAGGIASVPGSAPPTGKTLANTLPSATVSPGERLMQDLQAAAGVTLGHNDNAELLMVVAPECPHCKATWRELRESVSANRLQVKLIPITRLTSEETTAGALLLQSANPLEDWDKYVAGDKSVLSGKPDGVRVQAVMANSSLVDRWNIRSTPYLVYRAKDGRVKIVQGKPDRMAAVLSDLLK